MILKGGTRNYDSNLNVSGWINALSLNATEILVSNLDVTNKITSDSLDVTAKITSDSLDVTAKITSDTLDVTNKLTAGSLDITTDLVVTGDLTVNGTTVTIDTQTMLLEDNLIMINYGQIGTPDIGLISGLEVERGDLTNYQFIFQESDDSFRVGEVGSTQAVATRQDTPLNAGIAYWDSTANSFLTEAGLTYNASTNALSTTTFIGALTGHASLDLALSGGTMLGVLNVAAGLSQGGNTILNGTDTWLRTTGATGWYSTTYGGGIYMTESTTVKIYSSKAFAVESTTDSESITTGSIRTAGGLGVEKNIYMGGWIGRSAHEVGALQGGYNNVSTASNVTSPIYVIGSNYKPDTITLANMYGIGYAGGSSSFKPAGATGWGMYVAASGVARVWLDGNSGDIINTGLTQSNGGFKDGNFHIVHNEADDSLDFNYIG